MNKRDKVRAQVKSRFYYMFWGTATISVVAGQIYLVLLTVLWEDQWIDGLKRPLILCKDHLEEIVVLVMKDLKGSMHQYLNQKII